MNQGNGDVTAHGGRPDGTDDNSGDAGYDDNDVSNGYDGYEVRPGVPTADTYRRLRRATGLGEKSAEGAAIGLPNTWYGVTVHAAPGPADGADPVGMGRIIGDGGCFFQIVDICVLPQHQGHGLGKRIMAALTAELERRAPAGAYVSLIADGDARHLYAKFGFTETAPASVGMAFMPRPAH
ncbi:GNAT family N-acetyltransferase [Streptomyces chrestomyceticus]|uniref:GNAT family N-acetyltransferase n=1 Tax=Streptomyces chrestomyceticus TaxID=68185 RepID=UPI0019D1E180|nr:GNAT family N-acetyltransferase [Streptomyces chrestomyceticus]